MFHLTKWDLDKRSQTLHKEQLYQGSGKHRNPGKPGKTVFFVTLRENLENSGNLRLIFEIDLLRLIF